MAVESRCPATDRSVKAQSCWTPRKNVFAPLQALRLCVKKNARLSLMEIVDFLLNGLPVRLSLC
jgi:hypothetical protein